MLGNISMHRMDKGDVVDTLGGFWKNIADPFSAFAILLEFEGRGHQAQLGIAERLAIDALRSFAGVLGDHRLVIEGVEVGGAVSRIVGRTALQSVKASAPRVKAVARAAFLDYDTTTPTTANTLEELQKTIGKL